MGQYVARNLPGQAHLLGVAPEVRIDPFPQPAQLNRDELAHVSVDFYTVTAQDERDQDGYSPQQVIEEIKKRSPKGLDEMRMVAQDRQFTVDLIARGGIRVDPDKPELPKEIVYPD